jgi:pseudouridine kinase
MVSFEFDNEAPVLLIGAASIDVIGRVNESLQAGSSSPARIRSSFGGAARNVAENLARLGQPASLISVVGSDQVGEQLIHYTQSAGVDISAVWLSGQFPTGSYLAVINARGELEFALDDMRVLSEIDPDMLEAQADAFASAAMVFVDANLSAEALAKTFELASAAGVPVCADPTSVSLAPALQMHLDKLFLLAPNSREAGVYLGHAVDERDAQQGVQAAKALLGLGVELAIVTLAEFGLAYASAEGSGHIPAIKTEIVDPTGGGDALTAAVMFALLNSIPTDEAVRLGVSAASLTLRQRGSVRSDLSLELLYDQLVI